MFSYALALHGTEASRFGDLIHYKFVHSWRACQAGGFMGRMGHIGHMRQRKQRGHMRRMGYMGRMGQRGQRGQMGQMGHMGHYQANYALPRSNPARTAMPGEIYGTNGTHGTDGTNGTHGTLPGKLCFTPF